MNLFLDSKTSVGSLPFSITARNQQTIARILNSDPYTAATAFIRGEFEVRGDFIGAVRFYLSRAPTGLRARILAAIARLAPWGLEHWFQTRGRAARNIRFHYDRSNEFYRTFLDARLVYSCAYFRDPAYSIDEAQAAKLDHICRKLDLRRDERFLDIGCGWGGLVTHAAEHYGVRATGCTLSLHQYEYAQDLAAERGLAGRISIRHEDYRALTGRYDKIASVGMFEHVGRRRAGAYFRNIADLLEDGGLFLNHAIARPQTVKADVQSLFVRRYIFPGGELVHLSDVVLEAENAGFEVLDVENLRPHYALTCRAWVARLQQNEQACLEVVDEETYCAWVLFLAAASVNFEDGLTDVYQVLLAKRRAPHGRRLSREYMYR